ncbi:MAG: Adenylosuccinate synthetase [Chloroflexi bacterium]|jgi:adenylosuccinate synthase|nr:Adenylosuccinate synthetase [Chloroflexota bacterium]
MTIIALIGGQWGEEGKGKLTELLGEQAKVVVRFSGGGNPRQPVDNNYGSFNLKYIPRSIFNSRTISVLGAGMVIDPRKLVEERQALKNSGVDMRRFYISEQAHVVMPYHLLLEEAERKAYSTPLVDSPGSGLGPTYADKINRIGIRVCDLLQEELFLQRLSKNLAVKNEILTKVFGLPPLKLQSVYSEYLAYGRELRDHVFDTRLILQRAIESGHRILLESDQGSMLDENFGAYPYISNAAPTVGAASSSSGVPPSEITGSVGIFGAYITRMQDGPFPTEMQAYESLPLFNLRLMNKNMAQGRTSGSPAMTANLGDSTRRFGWFDAVAARFVSQLNGLTSIALTQLDGLDTFETIRICTEYQVHDAALTRFPSDLATLKAVRPVYYEMPGWQVSTTCITNFADLPPACQNFIFKLQSLIGVRVDMISTGPKNADTIVLRDPFNSPVTPRRTASLAP